MGARRKPPEDVKTSAAVDSSKAPGRERQATAPSSENGARIAKPPRKRRPRFVL
jgi:hypothetical protein